MPYYIRLMCQEDIAQVTEIDREAFPSQWPPVNYKHELDNRLAHYIVACKEHQTLEPEVQAPSPKGLALVSWVRRLFNNKPLSSSQECILGFAGFWIMADEAHITSIAVREQNRRRGIGELLLIAIIDLATELNAHIITLEVRASNTIAQNLYQNYGFIKTGVRRGYYTDNKEDGVIMSTEDTTSASFQARLQQLKQAHSRRWGVAAYRILR